MAVTREGEKKFHILFLISEGANSRTREKKKKTKNKQKISLSSFGNVNDPLNTWPE